MTIRIIIQSQWGGLLAIDVAPPSRLQLLPCAQASALAADSFATDNDRSARNADRWPTLSQSSQLDSGHPARAPRPFVPI